MSVPFLSAVERGQKNPSLETLERVAHSLGVSVRDLLPDRPPRTGKQSAADKAAKVVAGLARGASPQELKRFERVARAFFKANKKASESQFERMARAYFRA